MQQHLRRRASVDQSTALLRARSPASSPRSANGSPRASADRDTCDALSPDDALGRSVGRRLGAPVTHSRSAEPCSTRARSPFASLGISARRSVNLLLLSSHVCMTRLTAALSARPVAGCSVGLTIICRGSPVYTSP